MPEGVPVGTSMPSPGPATEGLGRCAGASNVGKKEKPGERRMIITRARSKRNQVDMAVGECCRWGVTGGLMTVGKGSSHLA